MIKKETIDQIVAAAQVEDVVGDYVHLKRRGVNFIGLCPFHDEKTPSFTVSPQKNIYKCFGCGKGGDSVRFVMEHDQMSYPEALKHLAAKYNIEVEETQQTQEQIQARVLSDSYYIVNEFAREYFENNLFKTQEGKNIGLSYFKERGFNEATIKKFQLGYSLLERDDLTVNAVGKKYNIDHLRALGLTTRNDIDFFRGRVMFSIHGISGKVIAFAGRTLSSDKKQPKYINSPESEIYNKRNILYALNFAKREISKQDECIMVEGYTDVITLHQSGIENAVASSGTSLTVGQIAAVRRYSKNIKIIYDGDAAGVKAAMRGLDLVLEQDMNVKLVLLPDGEDPDSYLKSVGVDSFRKYLQDEAKDFLFFKTSLLLEEAGDDPIQKSLVMKDIVSSIAKIPDPIKRSLYVQKSSKMMGIAEDLIIGEVNKVIKSDLKQRNLRNKRAADRQQRQQSQQSDGYQFPSEEPVFSESGEPITDDVIPLKKPTSGDEPQERDILRLLFNHGNKKLKNDPTKTVNEYVLSLIFEELGYFENEIYKGIIQEINEQAKTAGSFDINSFIHHEDEYIRNLTIDLISTPWEYANWMGKDMALNNPMPEENQDADAEQSVKRLLVKKLKKKRKQVQDTILELQKDSSNAAQMMEYVKVLSIIDKGIQEITDDLGGVILW